MLIFPYAPDIASLVLRFVLGITFMYHGWPKIKDPHTYGEMLFQGSPTAALFLAIAEFFGGLALILGFLTEVMSLISFAIMMGAIYYKVHKWKRAFHTKGQTGWAFDFALAGIAVALMLIGGGMLSIDAFVGIFP